jgi:hypothetical protein
MRPSRSNDRAHVRSTSAQVSIGLLARIGIEHGRAVAVKGEVMQRFASEIAQLRALGFAEGLPIEHTVEASEIVARLESGRAGLAVEFRVSNSASTFSIVSLGLEADDRRHASNSWSDILRAVHRRLPPNDDA